MGRDLSIAAVIPAYNAVATIRRALGSVLAQSEPPQQVIVVDDGSSDGTAEVAGEYGSSVRVVQQANAGASTARNRGLAECHTSAVAFLDADDEWLPEKLAQQRRIMRQHSDVPWCFAHMVEVCNGRSASAPLPRDIVERLAVSPVLPFFLAAERNLSTGTCGALLDLAVVQQAGGFNPVRRIGEDRDLWWRIAMRHPRIGYNPEVSWRYHIDTPGSLTKKSLDRSESLQVVCDHLRWWRDQDRTDFERYGRRLALNYLGRAAARQIHIERSILAEAEALLDLTVVQRGFLHAIRQLPPAAARRLTDRWVGK